MPGLTSRVNDLKEGQTRVAEWAEAQTRAEEEERMRAEVKVLAMEWAGCKCAGNE